MSWYAAYAEQDGEERQHDRAVAGGLGPDDELVPEGDAQPQERGDEGPARVGFAEQPEHDRREEDVEHHSEKEKIRKGSHEWKSRRGAERRPRGQAPAITSP